MTVHTTPFTFFLLITLVFIGFALVNGSGMYSIAQQREALFNILSLPTVKANLNAQAESSALIDELLKASKPPSPRGYAVFHGCVDVTVVVAIWYLTLVRWN